ncbi:cytochrome P460 family protein [Nitrosospira sp. NpAV]|uniref:cytochrome P460 family protein n=1 Tax=Nitrosospira sp. NpAV TaxID=58133 RepID=UPI00069836C3|nr:cytochrome P460 family protein [Nitrosospira sp. NpAV]
MLKQRLSRKILLGSVLPLLLSGMLVTQATPANALDTVYAKFNKAGELVRPVHYREWIFVGSPVTPKDMNDGKPAFPEFHNVYIDPASWRYWKRTGKFRDGTIFVLEMVSVGDKKSSSGNGYFQGEFSGVAAAVKSKKRFKDKINNWAYFGFGDKPTAVAQADDACAACHQANAADDMVFSQHYPVLRAAKPGEKPKRRGIGQGSMDLERGQ